MKASVKRLYLLLAMAGGFGVLPVDKVSAQTFTVLHSFTPRDGNNHNNDGAMPQAGLIVSGNTLYGTAEYGGTGGCGAVFAMNRNGTDFTNVYSMTSLVPPSYTNSDGSGLYGGVILSGNTMYGTSLGGGSSDQGSIFRVNTDGTSFTNLHSFTSTGDPGGPGANSDGALPYGGLVIAGNILYGTAESGGSTANGTIFAINTDGTGFTNLYVFTGGSDGAYPFAGLTLSGNTLYGTTDSGGAHGAGTVFAINTDGTGFTNLHSFPGLSAAALLEGTNSDGAYPQGRLIISGNTLYGTAESGGANGAGTVFKVNTDGGSFTVLYTFSADTVPIGGGWSQYITNSDGGAPAGALLLSGNTLYGTAAQGGTGGVGTVFAVNTDGSGFTNLYSFANTGDGGLPTSSLVLLGNTLYGTAPGDGSALSASGDGTIFSLSFAPQLTITPAGTNVVLSWPTNVAGFDYTGFTLQSTTSFGSATNWNAVLPTQTIIGGQCVVTNPASSNQVFYRLAH